MRLLIVDDEPIARRRMARMIAALPGFEVAGEAGDGLGALEQIAALAPDALLLDIHMPGLSGIELAARSESMPPIIFVTAYDQHAVDAFELNAVDYLLKPVEPERLASALARLSERVPDAAGAAMRGALEALVRGTPGPSDEPLRVSARVGDTLRLLDPRDITRFYAADKYAVCRHEGREWTIDDSLASLERRLVPHGFARVHRSELIQLARVVALHSDSGSLEAELDDRQRVPVSRRLAPELKRRLGIE